MLPPNAHITYLQCQTQEGLLLNLARQVNAAAGVLMSVEEPAPAIYATFPKICLPPATDRAQLMQGIYFSQEREVPIWLQGEQPPLSSSNNTEDSRELADKQMT